MHLYWTILSMTGTGWELFDEILALFQAEEARLPEWEDLKDYGRQHNLLEMRTCGYEYIVPSPNAERAWCFDRFADLAERLGREGAAAWRDKAERIRASIRKNLWDPQAKWFRCLHPDGCAETVYSIQMYDALRMGACDDAMTEALLDHLADGKFLGDYGVSSVSAEDALHCEWNDPDWSGGEATAARGRSSRKPCGRSAGTGSPGTCSGATSGWGPWPRTSRRSTTATGPSCRKTSGRTSSPA